ncbi:hypothetical protein Tco_1518642 [Tanacetum coccineum]
MNDPNITMDENIRLEKEKARRRAIVFNDTLMSEPTATSLDDEIDFRISFDDSDDEDYTRIQVSIRRILGNGYGVSTSCTVLGPRERNIDEYWWRIYKSRDLKVLKS